MIALARGIGKTDVMLGSLKPDQIGGPLQSLVKQGSLRTRLRVSGLVTAQEAVGELPPDAIVTGITKGGFSMLDLIEHLLSETGPADIDVSTWTMGVYDAHLLWAFAQTGTIKRLRFLLDPSIFKVDGHRSRHSAAFLAAFGGDAIRAVSNHAKFTVISGERRTLTVCGSMNLNRNKRLENFTVFDSKEVASFYSAIVDQAFEQLPAISDTAKVTAAGFSALYLRGPDERSDRVDWDDGAHPRHHRGSSGQALEIW